MKKWVEKSLSSTRGQLRVLSDSPTITAIFWE